ncbi:MFS transporter [Bacillus sp. B1-b2]|uniref:MFS transporter n=1 Tax=Bacillus sp. B1-b2 TaxID=2653201 RepID=UPI00126246CC|nr:MFS transporter [Bacillus sp. B1-b2]KAB7671277.1 MFS transporter [Bacillus sp. B1-b2]
MVVFLVGLVSWMMKKMPDNKQYFIGMAIFIIAYTILSYITDPLLLIVMMFFISIGELMYVPVNQSLLADLVNEQHRSSYLAVYGFIGQGQMILAGFAISISSLVSSVVMSSIFLLLGVTGIILMGVVVRANRKISTSTKEITAVP